MQCTQTIPDNPEALTTSYYEEPKGPAKESRHQQQQREAKAKAIELQKRYDYVNIQTNIANIGSKRNIIQERGILIQPIVQKAPTKQTRQASIKLLGIPTPNKSPETLRTSLSAHLLQEPLKEEAKSTDPFPCDALVSTYSHIKDPQDLTREQKHQRKQDEVVAKAAALQKQYSAMMIEKGGTTPPKQPTGLVDQGYETSRPFPMTTASQHPRTPPRAPPDTWQAYLPDHQMDQKDLEYLQTEGYPFGLIQAMTELKSDFAKQIFIIDNSESMAARDGVMLADVTSTEKRFVHKCSRWDELQECVNSHIRLAAALRQPTSFRLLNDPGPMLGPQQFGICESAISNASDIHTEKDRCLEIMQRNSPSGQTPLSQHIKAITAEVHDMRTGLLSSGKRVAIIICTDGVPTDASREDFLVCLRKLEALPVWLVVRLCTNEPRVVDFYNKLDEELKISVDVIDDFQGEALDICKQNPWLNYALPLHRARERGFHARVLDFLDECPLSRKEQKEVCGVIFGRDKMEQCPDPDVDPARFQAHVDSLQVKEKLQWDPIQGKVSTWFDFVGNPKPKLRNMGKLRRKKTSSFFGCFGM